MDGLTQPPNAISTGLRVGTYLQLGLGLATLVWALLRWAPILGLFGVWLSLRGLLGLQRMRTLARDADPSVRAAQAARTFR